MGFGAKPQARSQGRQPPINSPARMPGVYAQKALHDAEPTKHTQPFTEGKGLGVRDIEIALLIKI